MFENSDVPKGGPWRLLAELTLPIDPSTPDRMMARAAAAMAELHLPEVRLRQVREMIVDALANHASQHAILIRLFIAPPDGPARDHAPSMRGWGLFSIQKVAKSGDAVDVPLLELEVYLYT